MLLKVIEELDATPSLSQAKFFKELAQDDELDEETIYDELLQEKPNQKEKLKVNILQMAHHGQQGVSKEIYEYIKPKICLWPTPDWLWINDSGNGEDSGPWKTKETRKWIEELNVNKNIIEKDGNIKISI